MTQALAVLIPVVAALWTLFASIAIVLGRRRRAVPGYRPAVKTLAGLVVTFLIAFVGTICLLLVLESVPVDRIVRVLLLYDTGIDTMLLRFGLISAYGITVFAVITILRRRRR